MKNFKHLILPITLPLMLVLFSCIALGDGGLFLRVGESPSAEMQINASAPSPDSVLRAGRERYAKSCSSCHGEKGQGFAGPNLTDKYWLHGYGIKSLSAVITEGVPTKGMIGWTVVYTPSEIRDLASFILSLQGTNPPKAKKPEGALHE